MLVANINNTMANLANNDYGRRHLKFKCTRYTVGENLMMINKLKY